MLNEAELLEIVDLAPSAILDFVLFQWPELVPSALGILLHDQLFSVPVLAFVLCLIFCVGVLNAVNMAGVANGLDFSIAVMTFLIFCNEFDGVGFLAVLISCAVFLIFNVISGCLLLGDARSYGRGAALVLPGLFLVSKVVFSAPFLAVLLAYPSVDFVSAIVRRRGEGRAIFLPDHDHRHNRIHFHFQKRFH